MTATPSPGWLPDPHVPGRIRYWNGNQWTRAFAPTPSSTNHPPPNVGRDYWGRFIFTHPIARDWVFWWAVVVGSLTLVAGVYGGAIRGGFNPIAVLLNTAVAIILTFAIAVVPFAAVRYFINHNRGINAPPAYVTPAAAGREQYVRRTVNIDGGSFTFTRDESGHVSTTAAGFGGHLTSASVARAERALIKAQRAARQTPWF